eukprot:Platyproteum_vivax@DN794_c0_g1_i1.p1
MLHSGLFNSYPWSLTTRFGQAKFPDFALIPEFAERTVRTASLQKLPYEDEEITKKHMSCSKILNERKTSASVVGNPHQQHQINMFDEAAAFFASDRATPEKVVPRLQHIVETSFRLGAVDFNSYIIDAGCGTGALFPFFAQNNNHQYGRILGVDLSSKMLQFALEKYPSVHTWQGDFCDLELTHFRSLVGDDEAVPQCIVFNACFGNIENQLLALHVASKLLPKGGVVVISHPLGRLFVETLKKKDPKTVPHQLPTMETLEGLCVGAKKWTIFGELLNINESISLDELICRLTPELPFGVVHAPDNFGREYLAVLVSTIE